MTIPPVAITVDTHFLAQVEDTNIWEDRFNLLVSELNDEYGDYFLWPNANLTTFADIVFVMYPPSYHEHMVSQRAVEKYIVTQTERPEYAHIIVIGRNPKNVKVQLSDVVEIVNDQCLPCGIRAQALRPVRPEDLDDQVKNMLVRLLDRRRGGLPRPPEDMPLAPSSGVTDSSYSATPPYDRSDL